jgi:tetratricopeptide (TPR) repeat protein
VVACQCVVITLHSYRRQQHCFYYLCPYRNEIYFSNKAAALTSLKRYPEAVEAARRVIQLKPNWVKGHARLAAALFGLEEYGDARVAYEAAVRLEPNDKQLVASMDRARTFQARQEAEGRHKFKRWRGAEPGKAKEGGGSQAKEAPVKGPALKNKTLLSFQDDNEEDQD